jgi:hypothetical protein
MSNRVAGAAGPAEVALDEDFWDLVCSDEQWLRAEFDAIIAAEWAGPPTVDARRHVPPRPMGGRDVPRPVSGSSRRGGGRAAAAPAGARQRSPPVCGRRSCREGALAIPTCRASGTSYRP